MSAVSLSLLPELVIDEGSLELAAGDLAAAGRSLTNAAEDAERTWGGLSAVLQATGVDPLFSAVSGLSGDADGVRTALREAADALDRFAQQLRGLRFSRSFLESRIPSVRFNYLRAVNAPAESMSDFEVEQALADNRQMHTEISSFATALAEAESDCAAALNAIASGTPTRLGPVRAQPTSWSSPTVTFQNALADANMSRLRELGAMDAANVREWLRDHPEFADAVAASPPDPTEVAGWWHGLGDSADNASGAQTALIAAVPATIGALGGVAYWGRDKANRNVLAAEIARLSSVRSRSGRSARLIALEEIQDALDEGGTTPRQLIELDVYSEARPLAAISYGDLDTATNVNWMVSGMLSSTANMAHAVDDAVALSSAQKFYLVPLGLDATTASVAWIGYDSPNYLTVLGDEKAEAGGERLASSLQNFNAARESGHGDAFLAVDAHSYGTTTAAVALNRYDDLQVDALAMYGSAGLTVDSAEDLHISASDIYVGEAHDDGVADIGRFGSGRTDPANWDFGGTEYATNGGKADELTGQMLVSSSGHSGYLVPDTESLRNIALIGLDRGDLVSQDVPILAPGLFGESGSDGLL
jgi:hypothetical protein